jgi:hypothetical protein
MRAKSIRGFAPLWLVGLGMLAAAFAAASLAQADQPAPRTASGAQEEEFVALWKQYRKIYFDASVTGDVSLYPTVFANDPAVDVAALMPDCIPLINQERAGVAASLTALGLPPKVETGWLSCAVAEQLDYHRNVEAWQEVKAAASAQGRQPSTQALPNGSRPVEPTNADEWVEEPIYVIKAEMLGENQARVAFAGIPKEENPELLFNLFFSRIDNQWYITAMWTTGYGM